MALGVLSKFADNIVGVYDPLAVLPPKFSTVKLFGSARDCIMASDALVVMTPWEEFSSLDFSCTPKEEMKSFTVIDPYGIVNQTNLPKRIKVRGLTQK